MEILSFGIKTFKIGDIDPDTGLGTGLTEISVFKDSAELSEGDPQQNPIYSEQSPFIPKKIFLSPSGDTLKFSVMSTDADTLALLLGGVVTTVAGPPIVKTWNKADGVVDIEKYFEIETVDGAIIKIYRGKTLGKKNFKFSAAGILLIDVTVVPMVPLVADLSSMTIDEPSAA